MFCPREAHVVGDGLPSRIDPSLKSEDQVFVDASRRRGACLGKIYVASGLREAERDFVLLHELAHLWIASRGYVFKSWSATEGACDAIAAAFGKPRIAPLAKTEAPSGAVRSAEAERWANTLAEAV